MVIRVINALYVLR